MCVSWSERISDWGADIIFVFVFLHRLLGTHSKYSASVRSLSASVCLFVCLTFPTLRHSTVLKGADQEKRDWRGRSLFQKQKKKKRRTLVAVFCRASQQLSRWRYFVAGTNTTTAGTTTPSSQDSGGNGLWVDESLRSFLCLVCVH